jgi:hypothetical protein
VNTPFAKFRYLRIVGFAAGAVAVAGAAVLVTASAAGMTAGTHSASPQQATVESASISEAGRAQVAPLDKSTPSAICDAFLTHLTADLGKSLTKAQVNAAIQKAIGETLADEVKNGDLKQAQADALKAKLTGQPTCALAGVGRTAGRGGPAKIFISKQQLIAASASVLGISETQLTTDLANGKTLSELAAAHKPQPITEAQFRTSLIAKLTPLLTTAVNNKQMTADQKAAILKNLQTGPIPFWSKPVPHKQPLPVGASTT